MKQKIVVRVSMKRGSKYRSKALKIAASVSGNVEKISIEGDDKDKVEVIGDIDPIELTELLRKGFGSAQLESVSAVEKKDKDDKPGFTWTCSWGAPYEYSSYCYFGPYNTYPSYSIW